MKIISAKSVDALWTEQFEFKPEQIDKEFKAFKKDQPVLYDYLHEISDEELEQESYDFLFYLAMSVWRIMRASSSSLPKVQKNIVQQAFIKYQSYFDAAEDDTEAEDAILEIFDHFRQRHMISFAAEAIFENEEFDDYSKGFIFIAMLMTIDALDQ